MTVEQFFRYRNGEKYQEDLASTKDCPIGSISWYDTAAYCNWLSEKEGIPKEQWCYTPNKDGKYDEGMELATNYLERSGYRLPTEAEWEFACRAGTLTHYSFGDAEEILAKYGWYPSNSLSRSHPVSLLKSNVFGLFDMHGNNWEWTLNTYEKNYDLYIENKLYNYLDFPEKIDRNSYRVVRGGSYLTPLSNFRSAFRAKNAPEARDDYYGFRLARTITH